MNVSVLLTELTFKAVRSSGPGGQHVNKTASKVEVIFYIDTSEALTDDEKQRLNERMKGRVSADGKLSVQSSRSRSQHKNKALAIDKLIVLLTENLKTSKPRKKTKPSRASIEKRLKAKRNQALRKENRKPPKW